MLDETLTALAAAGGAAVVQAAGTDAWAEFRQALARWFGGDDTARERTELERLDHTATGLRETAPEELEKALIRQEAFWQVRIESALELLGEAERVLAANRLRTLLAHHAPPNQVSAGTGGLAVGGNAEIRAGDRSVAAGVLNGGVHFDPPPAPGPSKG
ncbi:hypothetical protein ACF1G0_33860 [Streptomyces sp. NPDC013953]|uniref:hypothetical protein n=1 Tax=Streptomyces sp. NPDC013953 TaxID=3364868 RepID=UPI0036F59FDF